MKQKIQIGLVVGVLIAGIRVGVIFYERHQEAIEQARKPEAPPLNPDYNVNPRKLFPYDLKTAKQLTEQPAWVKVGYAYPYYSYDVATRHTDFSREAGKLLPLQKLDIQDVVKGVEPKDPGERQLLAVFEQSGKHYAAPVGTERDGDYRFYSNDMLFFQDPHDLYKHWPADVWQAIDQHQLKPGMSELEADFAVGIGLLEPGSDSTDRTLDYRNGGKPLVVSFHDGKAGEITPGPPPR